MWSRVAVLISLTASCHAGLLGAGTGEGSCAAAPFRATATKWGVSCPAYASCCTEYGYCRGEDEWLAGNFRDCNGRSNGQALPADAINAENIAAANGDARGLALLVVPAGGVVGAAGAGVAVGAGAGVGVAAGAGIGLGAGAAGAGVVGAGVGLGAGAAGAGLGAGAAGVGAGAAGAGASGVLVSGAGVANGRLVAANGAGFLVNGANGAGFIANGVNGAGFAVNGAGGLVATGANGGFFYNGQLIGNGVAGNGFFVNGANGLRYTAGALPVGIDANGYILN